MGQKKLNHRCQNKEIGQDNFNPRWQFKQVGKDKFNHKLQNEQIGRDKFNHNFDNMNRWDKTNLIIDDKVHIGQNKFNK